MYSNLSEKEVEALVVELSDLLDGALGLQVDSFFRMNNMKLYGEWKSRSQAAVDKAWGYVGDYESRNPD